MNGSAAHRQVPQTGPRWLVIAEEEYVPTDSGGRVESLNILRALASAGIAVHVLIPGLSASSVQPHKSILPDFTIEGLARRTGWRAHASVIPYIFVSRPLDSGLVRRLAGEHAHSPFEAVLSISFRVSHLGQIIARALDIPLLVRPHNFESNYFREASRSARFPKSIAYFAEALKLRRAESAIHSSTAVALFADISESDAALRRSRTRTPVIHVPPFIPALPPAGDGTTGSPAGKTVLFVGSLDSSHNVEGLRWFLDECWPTLRRTVPGIEFHVVGRRASPSLVADLTSAGIRVTVDAPQIATHLAGADVFVNPIRQGSGVNIKVVEAMAAGLTVVTSSTGARGVPWRDGEHLVVADDPESFRGALTGLLGDPEKRARIGRAGQDFVREELDGVRQINRMRSLLPPPGALR